MDDFKIALEPLKLDLCEKQLHIQKLQFINFQMSLLWLICDKNCRFFIEDTFMGQNITLDKGSKP